MREKRPFRIYKQPRLEGASLVVGWREDATKLGSKVTDYLIKKLGATEFAEIEPAGFFPLSGVFVEGDVAQFPQCRFYFSREHNLVICKSSPPRSGWFQFMELILDLAGRYCKIKDAYTFGVMVAATAHRAPRLLLAVSSTPELKQELDGYDLVLDTDFETPTGQRPTLNSFFLWIAQRRGLAAASLWVPVPLYLLTSEDPRAYRRVLEFFNQRMDLGLDLADLDEAIATQDRRIEHLADHSPLLNHYLRKLESSLPLTQEENERLVKEIEDFLRGEG